MSVDKLDTGMKPEDLGGQESGTSIEVNVGDAARGWRWFWKWVRGEKQVVMRDPPAKSWTQQKEEENARKADEAVADLANETPRQREIRRQNREG